MNLEKLKKIFKDHGCHRALFKVLAANDNSKNQFYLGGDFSAVSILPCKNIRQEREGELAHTNRTKKEIFKADVEFYWLDETGKMSLAPKVQLILYPQYPEVRMSGFLSGCRNAPAELIRIREEGRILFFGIDTSGRIFGYVTEAKSPLAKEVRARKNLNEEGIFRELTLEEEGDHRTILLRELGIIHRKGYIPGKKLTPNGPVTYTAQNAGGYTLEAELGIRPNGFAEPDYMGWEIKQHSVDDFERIETKVITLLTPEPTGGVYRDEGPEAFIRKYGCPDRMGREDRLNFGGLHYINHVNERTGLKLILEGYDPEKGKITDTGGGICLVNDDDVAAKWPYETLIDHWKRKHAKAAYIPALCRKDDQGRAYWYGPEVRLCEGTDILILLGALYEGKVYYDPGIKLENASDNPKIKRRSQFRIHSKNIRHIYRTLEQTKVL